MPEYRTPFDIARSNTKGMEGYVAGGPHFCLGANLARHEIQVTSPSLLPPAGCWVSDTEPQTRCHLLES